MFFVRNKEFEWMIYISKEFYSMAYTSKNKIWFNDLQFHFSNEPTILGQINYPYYTITVGLWDYPKLSAGQNTTNKLYS